MTDILLPEYAFPNIDRDGSIFYPYVPIHPEVKEFAEQNGYETFDKVPTLVDSFYLATEWDFRKKLGHEEGARLVDFVRECPTPLHMFGRIEPKPPELFLLNGVFSINCDSIELKNDLEFEDSFYKHWRNEIGQENMERLNALLEHYRDHQGEITFVMSHNARAETLDPILHKNWALAFNNETLKHLENQGLL